jgi:RNA polymerase sigma-70 factor (ECF subfamily)
MDLDADDRSLIRAMARDDRSAIARLVARHQLRVFRFIARRIRNDAMAEEITNEVFLEAWRSASKFEGRSSVGTWLLAIAQNKAVSATRRTREESWDEDKAGELADGADNPEVSLQKADKGTIIRRCLDGLSSDHREIIDLVYYQELSIAEISVVLGVPEATVKTRMFYARRKLGDLLKSAGIDRGWP